MNNFNTKNSITRACTALGIGIIAIITYFSAPIILSYTFILICILILLFEWPTLCNQNPYIWLLTPFYPIVPFILLIHTNHAPEGRTLLALLFLTTWTFDTGSYFCGSIWGKTPIKRSISPGKTWEGALGGVCVASIVYVLFFTLKKDLLIGLSTLYIPLLLCIFGLIGDLFESLLKRNAQIKDSGHLLPGHGGLLDRFDSILFGIFFIHMYYSYLILLFKL